MSFRAASAGGVDRAGLLSEGEAALASGQTQVAIDAFERAASMAHSADAELGLVRAHLQAGRYRQALAFCAHVAGAHRESPAASVFYAWLLRAGGQVVYAQRLLEATRQRAPEDAVVAAGVSAFAALRPVAAGALLEPPHRVAPYALPQGGQSAPPVDARCVASGTLIDLGQSALVPASALPVQRGIWVRDGLGRTTAAALVPTPERFSRHGLAMLRLETPLRLEGSVGRSVRSIAGRPALALAYAPDSGGAPAWPWLRGGFQGVPTRANSERRLSLDLGGDSHGGPVLDSEGGLLGLVSQRVNETVLVPAAVWVEAEGDSVSDAVGTRPRSPGVGGTDVAYESGLVLALQVLAAR